MEFYQKLDLLMNLTSMTNSKLAKTLNVDPSLVSRWRRGRRIPNDFASVVIQIANLSAPRIQYDYQKEELAKKASLALDSLPEDAVKERIVIWLGTENAPDEAQEEQSPSLSIARSSTRQHVSQKDREEALLALGKATKKARTGGVFRIYMDNPILWKDAIAHLDEESTSTITQTFDALRLLIPSSVSYEDLIILWKQIEPFFGKAALYVSVLDAEGTDTFQHSILIADEYAMSSSFGFYGYSNTFTLVDEKTSTILDSIKAFDHAFDRGTPGLTYLETYTIWKDLDLFERIFSRNEDTYYYGDIINPLLIPPEILFKVTQSAAGVKEVRREWFLDLQEYFHSFLKNNRVHTTIRLFSPEEIAAGKGRAPHTPKIAGGKPTIGVAQYHEILVYIARLYELFGNLHIFLLREDGTATAGLQEADTLSIMKETDTGTMTYHSHHKGIISAAKRTLEEKFFTYEQENTRESTLQELRTHTALFEIELH